MVLIMLRHISVPTIWTPETGYMSPPSTSMNKSIAREHALLNRLELICIVPAYSRRCLDGEAGLWIHSSERGYVGHSKLKPF